MKTLSLTEKIEKIARGYGASSVTFESSLHELKIEGLDSNLQYVQTQYSLSDDQQVRA